MVEMNHKSESLTESCTLRSDSGRARCDTMLGELQRVVEAEPARRRTARRRTNAVIGFCTLVAAVSALAIAVRVNSRNPAASEVGGDDPGSNMVAGPGESPGNDRSPSAVETPRVLTWETVHTDPDARQRLARADQNGPEPLVIIERLSDQQLLLQLAALDHPTGLIYIGNEVRLTDDPLAGTNGG